MRRYVLTGWGIEHLSLEDAPPLAPKPGEVLIDVKSISLNYRDLLVIRGLYNPKQTFPCVPVSDGAGVVTAIGEGVQRIRIGDRVMGSYVADWVDGPFTVDYRKSTLGTPGPGMAAEQVLLPERAVVKIPEAFDFSAAATLPIAALTAWSSIVREGAAGSGKTVLTLGTGGVSTFALQFAKALGARVIITSSSDAKLDRARALGADGCVNYKSTPDWDKAVLDLTAGRGADITVETGGIGTLNRSLKATAGGGLVALLGAVTGLDGPVSLAQIFMKRIRVQGIFVDSRAALEEMVRFLDTGAIRPVIDRRFAFDQLPAALRCFESAEHFGKIVLDRRDS